jgi:aspartyl-tRNA(Asn)/glutamyl-tRNA(Gln) amidotransferase subunit C
MAVTLKVVEHVASLARLSFSDDEKLKLMEQLNQILQYMDELNTVNTDNIEPLSHVIELGNAFRQDELRESMPQEEILKNAPSHTDKFFKVPKVIGDR